MQLLLQISVTKICIELILKKPNQTKATTKKPHTHTKFGLNLSHWLVSEQMPGGTPAWRMLPTSSPLLQSELCSREMALV